MIRHLKTTRWFAALLLGAGLAWPAGADDKGVIEAKELVSEARFTVERLVADDAIGPDARALFDDAKAVMIFPSNLKAGLFLAGEGGGGILLARADNNEWSYPAFYTMGTGSVGLQVGAQESETIIFIMSGEGLEALLDGSATFGGELNAAAGSAGETRQAATTTAMGRDIISFGLNDGAFIGVSIEGSVILTNDARNMLYYGDLEVTPQAVVLRGEFANSDADVLRELLAKLSQPSS